MDSDPTVVVHEPYLLVLHRRRLPQCAAYLLGAIMPCFVSLGVNGAVSQGGRMGRPFGLVRVGACVATILMTIARLMFAVWTTTTLRASAVRIEA